MTTNIAIDGKTMTTTRGRELILERVIDAPREKVFAAWTEPEQMKQWFAPKPWTTPHVETDLRAGGASLVVMRSPEGQEIPCQGVYLEVVPNERLVFTDAFTAGRGAHRQGLHDRRADLRGSRRPHQVHRDRQALERHRPRPARADGLSPGLGDVCRAALGAGRMTAP